MIRQHYRRTGWAAIACIASLLPAVSVAQGSADRDTREVNAYVLTAAALDKYARATRNLDAQAKQALKNCEDDDGAQSIDGMVARVDANPAAKAAIRSAGMTTREYVVFTWSLFQTGLASWGMSQSGGKLPPGVSKANVDFYRANAKAIDALGLSSRSTDCDSGDDRD